MSLLTFNTEEPQAHLNRRIQDRIEVLEAVEPDPRVKVIYSDYETEAVFGLLVDDVWCVFVEDGVYEPSGADFNQDTEEPPFDTRGVHWAWNTATGQVSENNFWYEEGQKQGLIYGMLRVKGLDTHYVDWLISEFRELDDEDNHTQDLIKPDSRFANLLIKSELIRTTTEVVVTGLDVV